ncbi:MAG: DUF4058 family protein [Gemmataceae bacterium]|nr:DUF4058 family protein [Gemmataceae bacterium]
MPLRDHFRPPVSTCASWEGFHGQWPAMIVQQLNPVLPAGYTAEPRVHLGPYFEIDVTAFERVQPPSATAVAGDGTGVATAPWSAIRPLLDIEADWPDQYEYEVLVFDQERNRRLVAAVELVSPANKDRPESRRALVTKCAALLRQGVNIALVDLVTVRRFNLYAELLEWIGQHDPSLGEEPPATYAASLRFQKPARRTRLQTWPYPLVVGQLLPMLPLWISAERSVPLDLEASYQEACRMLRIL